ncbi:MAG: metallophosphoesterase [Isosphaeraceae bacterium]
MRIVHLSDVHVWRYTWDPRRLASKRVLGVLDLLRGRAGRFPLDRIGSVVDRVLGLNPDHILITGDLTTTALPDEFREARRGLAPLLADPVRVTVVPGNHDRATTRSVNSRRFEEFFGEFLPARDFPWLKRLDEQTGVLGLDATRSAVSPVGGRRAN